MNFQIKMNYLDSNLDCNTCANPSPQNKECAKRFVYLMGVVWGGGCKPLFLETDRVYWLAYSVLELNC